MAYKSNPHGLIRDQLYPSEIAAQRPALAARIHCEERQSYGPIDPVMAREMQIAHDERDSAIRGSLLDDRCRMFNEALRAGHGWRNSGDE
jgi:hypothetical protein